MALSLVGSMGLAGCRSAEEEAQSISRGITGTLSITGTVFDARGNGLPGVTVRLSGSSQATVVTGASGAYAFNGFGPSGYALQPSFAGCTFAPTAVNVNLTASTVINFDGSGATCGGASQNSGATTGSLTISGRVANAAGNPVPNIRINLNGAAQGVRTTDATGTYTFHVNPGSYAVQPSGPCVFTPAVANLNGLNASRVQNFVAGAGCAAAPAGSGGAGGHGGAGGRGGAGGKGGAGGSVGGGGVSGTGGVSGSGGVSGVGGAAGAGGASGDSCPVCPVTDGVSCGSLPQTDGCPSVICGPACASGLSCVDNACVGS